VKLDVLELSVRYGIKSALTHITLSVKPGQILAVIGPNGAGKSTLIRAISGVVPITSGKVRCGSKDLLLLSNPERARILGVVPQARQLGGAFTIEQTVMLGRTAYMNWLGKADENDYEAVRWALEQTSLLGLAHRRNAELSGGEQQRVLLARTLAQKTPILLLDEPTNHLDLKHQIDFLSLVRKLSKEENLAVLMAMHDLNQVSTYADQVAILVDGSILAYGDPNAVLTDENVTLAYQTDVFIINHPEYKTPLILPKRKI
jgi:iron complex transport system ATP-binding protein